MGLTPKEITIKLFLDMDVFFEDENACKAAWDAFLSRIRITGVAISRHSWDLRNQEWSKNNLRGIILGIWSIWEINAYLFFLVITYLTFNFTAKRQDNLSLVRKYARMFRRGRYLSQEANGSTRAKLEENLRFEEQIMHKDKYLCIFLKTNGGYSVH